MGRTKSERGVVSVIPTQARQAMGLALIKARATIGMTQLDISDFLGVTQMYISQWENGLRAIPADALLRLAGLGIRPAEVMLQAELELREMKSEMPHSSRRATAR